MAVEKRVYSLIKERLFESIQEANDEHKDSMRVLLLFDKDEDGGNICEVVELTPAPEPPLWDDVFTELAEVVYKETKRVPAYLSIINKIRYVRATKEDMEDDEMPDGAKDGYFMICLRIKTGDAISQLYTEEFVPEEGGDKVFSIFDTEDIKNFPPAIALASFVLHILLAKNNDKGGDIPSFDELKPLHMLTISLEEHEGERKFIIKDEEEDDDVPFSFSGN